MVGYDVFGNKSDITFCSTLEGLYKKIFFPEIAEKILLLGNKSLILKGLIHEVCFSECYNDVYLKSTLAHIAYFIEDTFKHELEKYIDSNKSTVIRILLGEEDKKDELNKSIDMGRLKKECRALLDTYKYLEA